MRHCKDDHNTSNTIIEEAIVHKPPSTVTLEKKFSTLENNHETIPSSTVPLMPKVSLKIVFL